VTGEIALHPNGLSRRGVLATLGAAAMTGLSTNAAAAPFFKQAGLPIGIQLYTLGPDAAKDLEGTLKAVAGIGYKTVELPGFMGKAPADLRAAMDRAGLICPSVHVQPRGGDLTFSGDLGKLAEALHAVGAKAAVAPVAYFPDRLELKPQAGEDGGAMLRRVVSQMTADDWKANAEFLNQKATALKAQGLKVGYHNHNFEFAPLGSTYGLEILLKETDPSLVTFEIDVGWVAAAGHDPAALMARHKGRFTMMHVKDVKASTTANFALKMDPTEVGSGRLDWKKLLPAGRAAGVTGFFVEQEPPFERPRIEAAKLCYDYLASVAA
jgi:sugar phosphate isomerase/epimerase